MHPDREQFHHDARDLAVLRDLIEANGLQESSSGADPDDGDGALEPLELGHQVWRRGRLVSLGLGPGPDFSYGYGVRVLPESLGDLDALRVLALGWNQLESLPDSLGHLQRLEELRLHDNRLESLPDSIGRLSRLRSLWLGRNQLRELPAAVGDLGGLVALHVDGNPLGVLPHTIGASRDLEVLNLGRAPERRAGLRDLPRSIEDLYRLETLYVGGNALGCDGSFPPAVLDGSIPGVYGLAHQRCAEAGPEPASQISEPLRSGLR